MGQQWLAFDAKWPRLRSRCDKSVRETQFPVAYRDPVGASKACRAVKSRDALTLVASFLLFRDGVGEAALECLEVTPVNRNRTFDTLPLQSPVCSERFLSTHHHLFRIAPSERACATVGPVIDNRATLPGVGHLVDRDLRSRSRSDRNEIESLSHCSSPLPVSEDSELCRRSRTRSNRRGAA